MGRAARGGAGGGCRFWGRRVGKGPSTPPPVLLLPKESLGNHCGCRRLGEGRGPYQLLKRRLGIWSVGSCSIGPLRNWRRALMGACQVIPGWGGDPQGYRGSLHEVTPMPLTILRSGCHSRTGCIRSTSPGICLFGAMQVVETCHSVTILRLWVGGC